MRKFKLPISEIKLRRKILHVFSFLIDRNQFGAAVPSSTESLDTASKPELDSISRILREILSELQQVHGVITHDSEGGSHTSPKVSRQAI